MTEQPSAADPARRSPSGADEARNRASLRRRAAIAVGVLALLVIGGILLLGGNVPGLRSGSDAPGGFTFRLGNVQASPITDTPPPDLKEVAREAGVEIKETMDELYFRAFVDAGSWGDYAAAFEMFDEQAAPRAEADVDVLTLGPTANELYESLEPTSGTLTIAVLTDGKDAPVTAVAEAQFLANARGEDGTSTEISSFGSFFLRPVEGVWRIFAYRVDREDRAAATPSPTGSPS